MHALARLYPSIAADAARFPREQTEREFLKVFGERIATFGGRAQADGTISAESIGGQAILKSIKDETEKQLFGRNARFVDVYLMGKYLSTFMNGRSDDSGFDLFLDLTEVEVALTGSDEVGRTFAAPRFGQDLTNIARFLKGTSAQAVTMDPNIRTQKVNQLASSGTITFKDEGIPVCALPGVVQEGDAALDEAAKTAVLGRLIDLDEAIATAENTVANERLLNFAPEKSLLERLWSGETLGLLAGNQCVFDVFCARLQFIKSVPTLAPGRIERPLPMQIALKTIETLTRTLSNTPLETKSVGRSPLSYTFANLNFLGQTYTPTVRLDVRWVPVFQEYDPRKSFNTESFDQLVRNYTSLLQGGLNRSTTSVVQTDRSALSQVMSDVASREKTEQEKARYKDLLMMRTTVYWNYQYLKVVGDRFSQLSAQISAMDKLFLTLQTEAQRLSKAKPIYSK